MATAPTCAATLDKPTIRERSHLTHCSYCEQEILLTVDEIIRSNHEIICTGCEIEFEMNEWNFYPFD